MLRERGWTGFVERDLLETDNGTGCVEETAGFYGTSDIPVVSVCGAENIRGNGLERAVEKALAG